MGDYVFKVKLFLVELGSAAFYYRQSICEDKLNSCFQDLRNEVMRRYDLRPSIDVKGNIEFLWCDADGDMITISTNDDLNIFMGLKGTSLVVVRTQLSSYGFNSQFTPQLNLQFSPQFIKTSLAKSKLNNCCWFPWSPSFLQKPSLFANSVALNAGVHNEKSGGISKTVELPHQSNYSFVDAIISNSVSGVDVSHVENDWSNHTAKASGVGDSSAIPDSVSVNDSTHLGNSRSKNESSISNVVPQVTSPIPNLHKAVAEHIECDQLKSTGNMTLGDMSPIPDWVSVDQVNTSNVGDDQPKITTADQEIIPKMWSTIPDLRTADEDNQPEDPSVVQEIVPQIALRNSNLRGVDAVVNVENDQSKYMENASLVRDSSSILDSVSVNVGVLGEIDQTNITSAIQNIVPQIISPISNLRTVDTRVNVGNDQHTSTIVKDIVVSSSIPSHILSHEEVLAKLENMLQCRSKQQQIEPPQNPIPAPQLPTPEPELPVQAPEHSAQTPELTAHAPELLTYAPELPTKTLPTPIPEIPKFEDLVHYRFKERSLQPPLRPLNFSLAPSELPIPLSQLSEPTKHSNPRVQAALNIMTSQMKFSNSGGWLERLLEAVDGNIDEAMRKLQPKMH